MTRKTLSQDLWIAQGFVALGQGGADAIRVEPMARALGASKGSFYWHFRDLRAFQRALWEAWERAMTDFETVAGIDDLFARAACDQTTPRVASALRQWAQEDPELATIVARVDRRRQVYLAQLMEDAAGDGVRLPLLIHALQLGLDQLEQSLGPMPEAARRALWPKPDAA